MLKRNLLIAGLILAAGFTFAGPAWAVDTSRIKINPPPVIKDLWTYSIDDYDQTGPRANWEAIPGGPALEEAARDYVLLTGDFDVSLQDVVDNGLWPYDTFPHSTDMQDRLYGFDKLMTPCGMWDPERNAPRGPEIGSVEWWIESRNSIVQNFYQNYYYSVIDLEHVRTAEIGPRYDAFWTNPATGQPMVESKEYGDIWLGQLSAVPGMFPNMDYLNLELLDNLDAIHAALESIPLVPNSQNDYTIDLHSLDPSLSGIMTLYNTTESYVRSLENAQSIAKTFALRKMEDEGKLNFDFDVPMINSLRLPEE